MGTYTIAIQERVQMVVLAFSWVAIIGAIVSALRRRVDLAIALSATSLFLAAYGISTAIIAIMGDVAEVEYHE